MSGKPNKPAGHAGHRERLRDRFLNAGADALADDELLELILFSALPRVDTKATAKDVKRGAILGHRSGCIAQL